MLPDVVRCAVGLRYPRRVPGRKFVGEVDESHPLVGLAVVIPIGPDDDVGVAVPVHVPRRAGREAKKGPRLVALGLPVGILRRARLSQSCGRTVPDEDGALVDLPVVVPAGSDDHIVIAVAVHIPRCTNRVAAEVGPGLVAFRHPVGIGWHPGCPQPCGRTIPDEDGAFVALPVVVPAGPDDDVIEAVAVHIPRRAGSEAKETGLIALGHPVGIGWHPGCPQPCGRTVPDKNGSLICLAVAILLCSNNNIAVPISVHIPGRAHRNAKLSTTLVALRRPVGCRRKTPT